MEAIDRLAAEYRDLPIQARSYFIISRPKNSQDTVSVHSILDYEKLNSDTDELILAFSDPCSRGDYPGWPLRNLLAYVACKAIKAINKVLCYRLDGHSCAGSLLLEIDWSTREETDASGCDTYPGIMGWERNLNGKLLPRKVDLGATLDPKMIATNAVDLNLKLMRWRLVPNLDLEKLTATKCLLLGSGTLGCNVARALLVGFIFIVIMKFFHDVFNLFTGLGCPPYYFCRFWQGVLLKSSQAVPI